jgi:hypothetical protein
MPANRKRESIEAELNVGETDRITKRLRDTLREFEEVEKGNWASSFKPTPDKQRWPALRRLFRRAGVQMNYQAFTNDSLTMMYEGVRGALAADDAWKRQELETRFRVRETPEWNSTPLISNPKC